MAGLDAGTRRWMSVAGLLAATMMLLGIAAAFRPGSSAPRLPRVGRDPATPPLPPSAEQDALSTLQPSEMLHGCLNCPVSSYLGTAQQLR
jgi:hypothetical protein